MNSNALGNYIHLVTANYLKYGVNEPYMGPSGPYIPIQNFLTSRVQSLNEIKDSTLTELKMRVAADADTVQKRDQIGTQKKWEKTKDQILQDMASYTDKNLIGRFQGEQSKGEENKKYNQYKISNYGKSAVKKAAVLTSKDIQAILQQKEIIEKLISKINNSQQVSQDQIENIVNLYNKLGIDQLDASETSVIGKIQSSLIDLIYETQYNIFVGDFGERLLYAARDCAEKKARKMANGTLEGIVGRQTSAIKFNANEIAVDLNKFDSQTFKYADKYSKIEYKLGESQDKVDVNLILNGEDLFASVKNYKDLSVDNKVKLQKVDVFTSLIYLNRAFDNFGNHWLNMHAATNPNQINQSDKNNADEVLKQEFAYEALVSGNPLKNAKNAANIFVVIDRFSGKVYAKSMKKILLEDFNQITMSSDISTIHYNNKFSSTPGQRIANILIQAHKEKIQIGFKVQI